MAGGEQVQPLWQTFQERAQRASAKAAACVTDNDFDGAEWYRGMAAAFREAEVLTRVASDSSEVSP